MIRIIDNFFKSCENLLFLLELKILTHSYSISVQWMNLGPHFGILIASKETYSLLCYFCPSFYINKFSSLFQLIFVALSLFKWNEPILSQTAVGVAGVLLVAITNAAALGFCAVFGIPFNASSTQVNFTYLLERCSTNSILLPLRKKEEKTNRICVLK